MPIKKILITQSNYIPWIGYFDAISQVDEFVVLDCVQYTRRDWRNRNKILTPQGPMWLTIPVHVKGKYSQKIFETQTKDLIWPSNHWKSIQQNYSKAPYFNELKSEFENIYQNLSTHNLSQINLLFIKKITEILKIDTSIKQFDEYEIIDDKTDRLLSICKQANASSYLTGPAARDYLDLSMFKSNGIDVIFFDFSRYPSYPQLHSQNSLHVSILDLLFNIGPSRAQNYLGHCIERKALY